MSTQEGKPIVMPLRGIDPEDLDPGVPLRSTVRLITCRHYVAESRWLFFFADAVASPR